MRKLFTTSLLFVLLSASVPARASTATDFYLELLRRGTAEVDAGRYDSSITALRLAAFGLIDSIEQYEIAQAYLAVALDKLGQQEEARRSALRIVTAEGIERRFASAALPATIRTAFMTVARKVLSASEVATLTSAAPVPATVPRSNGMSSSTSPVSPPQTKPSVTTPRQETRTVRFSEPEPAPARQAVTPPQARVEAPKPPVTAAKPQTAQTTVSAQADVASRVAAAERALGAANLTEASRIYRDVLTTPSLDRATLIRIGEGLYRARDFAQALTAFRRLGALRAGEEAYRYYIAVALYETADLVAAKRELAAALPYIEITPDVQRYRAKIEGTRN
jgi:tetratricopeptide (TPR) repeat protein